MTEYIRLNIDTYNNLIAKSNHLVEMEIWLIDRINGRKQLADNGETDMQIYYELYTYQCVLDKLLGEETEDDYAKN